MVDTPSLQPRQCDECNRQMMSWEVSTSNVSEKQEATKDITQDKASLSAFLGGEQERTIEATNTEGSKSESGKKSTFYFCSDPTCENHLDGVRSVVAWKLMNASSHEYSDEEINQKTIQVLEQSIHDSRIVSDTVENSIDTRNETEDKLSTNEGDDTESSQTSHTDIQEETNPAQQLGPCKECGEHLNIRGASVQNSTSEQNLNKSSEHWMYSLTVSSSLIPFVEASGETGGGDESTSQETSRAITADKATFPICSNQSCEAYLTRRGQIECWKMRSDDTREYSAEEVDNRVTESLIQEVRYDRVATNAVEDVHSRLLSDSQDQNQETDPSLGSKSEAEESAPDGESSASERDDSTAAESETEGERIREELRSMSVEDRHGAKNSKDMDNRKDDDDPSPSPSL